MRVLFVAMANSVHTARWISQLAGQGWDIHLFPVGNIRNTNLHPDLRNVTIHDVLFTGPVTVAPDVIIRDADFPFLNSGWSLPRGRAIVRQIMSRVCTSWNDRAARLTRVIQKLQPDIVHSLEMQQAGYLTIEVKKQLSGSFPSWIYSAWGSDLFYFGRQPDHESRIREVLAECDYYIADCQRDVQLAKQYGFSNEVLGVFPTAGAYDTSAMQRLRQPGPIAERKIIALKGYHADDWAGRALVALQALHQSADCLKDYEIVVYLAGDNVRYAAEYVSRITGLHITILPQSIHEEIIKLLGRARIAIGVNVTDGTPNSMLEAMVMGAFPIQSDTISTAEWITDGENGFLVPAEDPDAIESAIRQALTDDALVERAAEINACLTKDRLDKSVLHPQIIAMYQKVAAQAKRRKSQ